MEYQWVISTYTGDRAKSVKAHADAGIGYFIQQEAGAGQGHTVRAAFRRPMSSPPEVHMEICDLFQIKKLDDLDRARHGIQTRQ